MLINVAVDIVVLLVGLPLAAIASRVGGAWVVSCRSSEALETQKWEQDAPENQHYHGFAGDNSVLDYFHVVVRLWAVGLEEGQQQEGTRYHCL